jgi:hypothetical protein
MVLAAALGCQVGSMPFPYLGLPIGTTKPSIQDFLPIVEGVERRLISTSIFLSQGARLQLITPTLSSIPIYFLLSLKLPPGMNIQLEIIIRPCLWRDKYGPKQSRASWEMVCKPRDKGGLGIVNFSKKNDSLLLKHLDKFYKKTEVPWVQIIWFSYYTSNVPHAERLCGSFWWRDIFKLVEGFREVTQITPGSGETFLFWCDNWQILDSYEPLSSRFP